MRIRNRSLSVLAAATLALTLLFAVVSFAGAQEDETLTPAENAKVEETQAEEGQVDVDRVDEAQKQETQVVDVQTEDAEDGESIESDVVVSQAQDNGQRVKTQAGAVPQGPSGPLAGEVVEVRDRNDNGIIDRGDVLEIRGDYSVEPGASITVEDGNNTNGNNDNTQGTFVDGQNATITETDEGIEIEVEGPPIGKVALNGDDRLTRKGVEVVTSDGVKVSANDNGGGSSGGGGSGGSSGSVGAAEALTCDDFATQAEAQAALTDDNASILDSDGDGTACEDEFAAAEADAAEADAGAAEAEAGDDGNIETAKADDGNVDAAAALSCVEILDIFRASGSASAQYEQYKEEEAFDLFSDERLQECLASEVIDRDDVKGVKLADTGGAPILPIAAMVLAGVGIFVGRSVLLGSSRDD